MNSLRRNKRKIYYALYSGKQPVIDADGYETGEEVPTYTSPVEYWCNISAGTGYDQTMPFGDFTDYSRTITVTDKDCPIDEDTVIWFGIEPTEPYNYIVRRKADSINGYVYALQKVDVQ